MLCAPMTAGQLSGLIARVHTITSLHTLRTMRKAAIRIVLVAAAQLLLFEALLQFSVHQRESTGELCTLAHGCLMLIGSIWALLPAFKDLWLRPVRVILRGVAAGALFTVLYAGDYYYSWHLRPNLGLYREPDWVAEHPGFQRDLRGRVQSNIWNTASR